MFNLDFLAGLHPMLQALLATGFTWGMTALGAALVFVSKSVNKKLLHSMLGFAAGVMIAIPELLVPSKCRRRIASSLVAGRSRLPGRRPLPRRD
jgi:hypothetical protein